MSFVSTSRLQSERKITPLNLVVREYVIKEGFLGRDPQAPFKFSLPEFKRIYQATLTITLASTKGPRNVFGQELSFFGWRLNSFVLNGKTFIANGTQETINKVDDFNTGLSTLKTTDNILQIRHEAPLGAGTPLLADVPFEVRLHILGENAGPLDIVKSSPSQFFNSLSNLQFSFKEIVDRNTPLAITILVLVVIGIVGIAYIMTRVPNIPISANVDKAVNVAGLP